MNNDYIFNKNCKKEEVKMKKEEKESIKNDSDVNESKQQIEKNQHKEYIKHQEILKKEQPKHNSQIYPHNDPIPFHHHRPPYPPHGHHGAGNWYENYENWNDLTSIGNILISIGHDMKNGKQTTIGKTNITPDDPSLFRLRYERMPAGELKLLFEIEWNLPTGRHPIQGTNPLEKHLHG